jgi:alpha/beta superfamily hydrolase
VLTTPDGLRLEAEYAPTIAKPVGAAVLCHPHPRYGGSMRSILTSELFAALPPAGIACLRFNFRGVESSEGSCSGGEEEPFDALAAIDAITADVGPDLPIALVGWSFGADIALSVVDDRLAGWIAIAAPLRFRGDFDAVSGDPRPKLFVLGANDEIRPPDEVAHTVAGWTNTRVEIVAGASHFFVGRTDRVVDATGEFFAELRTR